MLARYVWADLVRNPRRTLSTMIGVTLGVGLFCGVLFFVDGLSASMTQRAVAPLPIDIQRIVTNRFGGSLTLEQQIEADAAAAGMQTSRIVLVLRNDGEFDANEVTVRSLPGPDVVYVAGSATLDGVLLEERDGNPLARGTTQAGLNVGTIPTGAQIELAYVVEHSGPLGAASIASSVSTRETPTPVAANQPLSVPLADLAGEIAALPGVASATELSIGDLGTDALTSGGVTASGSTKIFGFDRAHADRDQTIRLTAGELADEAAVLSAEASADLGAAIGDTVSVRLPDDSQVDLRVSGIADLSEARSLFSSRRGGDLETFKYVPNAIVVPAAVFADTVLPTFERAATEGGTRLKSPPILEVDITLARDLLDADPATAATETERIAASVAEIAAHQDYLLDNVTNTLVVAAADARVAKRLFAFLGVPGALLAAMLAGYAGNVLAEAQRREQAILRIRGANRRQLLRMLALHTALITAAGSVVGLAAGYVASRQILGAESLARASTSSLLTSAVIGTVGGFVATGAALYVTARRSVDREINDDRSRLAVGVPLWRRARLDVVGVALVVVATVVALRRNAFDGASGSVYFGRAVQLNVPLLVLPVAVWISGALLAARVSSRALMSVDRPSSPRMAPLVRSLVRRSAGRRPWPIANAAIVVALVVALTTTLAAFTKSYDSAKAHDARFANGGDVRITPNPAADDPLTASDAARFENGEVTDATPVIFGLSNVILRSDRTSDPANLAAVQPDGYLAVAPVSGDSFVDIDAAGALALLRDDATAALLSEDMAGFLKVAPGDRLQVLLARATDDQVVVDMHVAGLFNRLSGFPDGADALMAIDAHLEHVPAKHPDFFLANAANSTDAGLGQAAASLEQGAVGSEVRVDTSATTLATDQSSLAALNIEGLVALDGAFAFAMAAMAMAIFVFGLLLQRRREYVTLRAQGVDASTIRRLISAEAGIVAIGGSLSGIVVGAVMGAFFVAVLRPLFVLTPAYLIPASAVVVPAVVVAAAAGVSALIGFQLVQRLEPTELLRDE